MLVRRHAAGLMGVWVVGGLLLAVLILAMGRSAFRRYQDMRIRQHRHRMGWEAYKQSRAGRQRWW